MRKINYNISIHNFRLNWEDQIVGKLKYNGRNGDVRMLVLPIGWRMTILLPRRSWTLIKMTPAVDET